MTERPFSPEEFVKLLSLPEDHPERLRAESSGMLEAWRRMLSEFEAPPASVASSDELASADATLERGMAGVLNAAPLKRLGPATRRAGGSGLLSRLAAALTLPAARPAFALGVIAIAASGLWWSGNRHTPRAVRSGNGESAIVVAARTIPGETLELSWAIVPGAESYRVRFFGASLVEIARLDNVPGPILRLERRSLPADLTSGGEVLVEVAAVRRGDVIAVSSSRAVRLP